jgi:hypothetical protein
MLKVTTKSPEQRSFMSVSVPEHTVMRQCLNWLDCHYQDLFADHRTKKCFIGAVVALFLEATLRKRKSIEEICLHLQSRKWLQEWTRLTSVSPSTLYGRLEQIPLSLLQELYRQLLDEIARHYIGKPGLPDIGPLYAVDSTEIALPPHRGLWAFTTAPKNFVRMHTCLRIADETSACPHRIVLSTGAVHEQEVLSHLVIDADATYVFDRGYVNYERFIEWAEAKILFVARLKHNNKCQLLVHHPLPEHSSIRLDAEVRITHPVKKITAQLRLVEYDVVDRHGKMKRIRVLTNRRDVSAEAISEIYRGRWRVETFFKWMKQHSNLGKLYSTKEKAVWNQIYLSLIAHALCELVRLTMKPEATCRELLQLLRIYADVEKRSLEQVLLMPTRRKKRDRNVRPRERPPNERQSNEKKRIVITE